MEVIFTASSPYGDVSPSMTATLRTGTPGPYAVASGESVLTMHIPIAEATGIGKTIQYHCGNIELEYGTIAEATSGDCKDMIGKEFLFMTAENAIVGLPKCHNRKIIRKVWHGHCIQFAFSEDQGSVFVDYLDGIQQFA